jgi:DNA-binding response OmpR family regulator
MESRIAKILIIDDEERNRRLFEVFVKADGFDFLVAESGTKGIALAIAEAPDLILLDLMMSGLDGFEVARSLKANPITRSIPIIVLSSLSDIASHQRMLASGVDEFIVKPVNRWELSLRISKLLQNRSQPSAREGSPNPQGETGNG